LLLAHTASQARAHAIAKPNSFSWLVLKWPTAGPRNYFGEEGSQLSFHTFMLSPSPTLHTRPSSSTPLAWQILLHAKEGLLPKLALKNGTEGKYFSFNIWATKESGFCIIHHPCFASSARLKTSRSRKPIPPSCFANPIHFQLIHVTPMDSLL